METSYATLWQEIWRSNSRVERREYETMRALIKRVRAKLRDNSRQPQYLDVRRGLGVILRRHSLVIRT